MAITKAIIIHGTGSSPQSNWFPWLKSELEKMHLNVFAPQFPTGEPQSLTSWMSEFKRWEKAADTEAIMIGHSIGPAFILNFLERSGNSIAAAFLVAPFVGKLGNKQFDSLNRTFAEREFDWNRIKRHCGRFFIYSSDDDPYVPLEKGEFLSSRLNARFRIIHGGGHINVESGYRQFDLLLEDIKSFVKASASSTS